MIAERKRVADPSDNGAALRLMFPATDVAVRAALRQWRLAMGAAEACPDLTGRAEIVLAEVLNNITEHGTAGDATGWIGLRCDLVAVGLRVSVTDRGRPLPVDLLASTRPIRSLPCDPCLGEVPEGGFGWQMIRLLARDISCKREADLNRLRFLVPRY